MEYTGNNERLKIIVEKAEALITKASVFKEGFMDTVMFFSNHFLWVEIFFGLVSATLLFAVINVGKKAWKEVEWMKTLDKEDFKKNKGKEE